MTAFVGHLATTLAAGVAEGENGREAHVLGADDHRVPPDDPPTQHRKLLEGTGGEQTRRARARDQAGRAGPLPCARGEEDGAGTDRQSVRARGRHRAPGGAATVGPAGHRGRRAEVDTGALGPGHPGRA